MKKLWTRLGAAVLCAVLLLGMLPLPATAANTAGISPDAALALAQVLQEQLNQYGQGELEADPWNRAKTDGILYAGAEDFDRDGDAELILTRVAEDYVTLEVYRADGASCRQIYSQEYQVGGSFDIYYVGLHRDAAGNALLYEDWWSMREGREMTNLRHWTLDGATTAADGYETELALFGYNTGYLEAEVVDVASVVTDLNRIAGGGTLSAESALQQLPYAGDRSLCKMNAKMARAYAGAIASQPASFYDQYADASYPLQAILVDPARDGMPLLATAYVRSDQVFDFKLWTWDGTKAEAYPFEEDIEGAYVSDYQFGGKDGKTTLFVGDSLSGAMEFVSGSLFYDIAGGQLNLREKNTTYLANSDDGFMAYGTELPMVRTEPMDGGWVTAPIGALLDGGWTQLSEYNLRLMMQNGKVIPEGEGGGDPFVPHEELQILESFGGSMATKNTWGSAQTVQQLLESYANAGPAYGYPVVTEDDDEYVRAVAEAVAAAVGGEISAIYKLSDGVYYVLITVDGATRGALVQGVRKNGQVVWNVTETHDTPLDPEDLEKLAGELLTDSNITVDYDKVGGSLDDIKECLQSVLDNMNGLTPNDAAKQELAGWVESALSAGCSGSAAGKDNRLELDGDALADLTEQAKEMSGALEQLLTDNGVTLNRPLVIRVRILWSNLDWGAPCQFTINDALLEAMDGCTVQLLLGDGQHGLMLSPEAVKALVERYGSVAVRVAAGDDGLYTIQFLDESGSVLEALDTAVTVFLPCESPTATVMATYGGGSDNWGGQYDERTGVISFDVRYSGDYQVLENNIPIDDITELPEETQKAIRFMVSKGYFSLEDGKFLPQDPLNRYAFSEALVGMFFALDRSAETSFTDVPADSAYYPYVASGEQDRIIEGFDDGTFRGENELTVEQMLALAARTLIEQKGYAVPADPEQYLMGFSDGLDTSDWAVEQVALAIREGLMDPGGELNPQEPVTRAQAALILYRLFLLLHEVSPVALDLPPVTETDTEAPETESPAEPEDDGVPVAVIAAVAVVVVAGGGGVWYWLHRRKARRQ